MDAIFGTCHQLSEPSCPQVGYVLLLSLFDEDRGKKDDPLGEGVVHMDTTLFKKLGPAAQ